jgi:uncharacterized protein YjiS (DUF1127 family)
MSLLNGSSNYSEHPYAWDMILSVGRWLFDLVKGFIIAMIAERERQASLAVLRSLNDRELRDMGIFRGQINEGLEEAARLRASHQRPSR